MSYPEASRRVFAIGLAALFGSIGKVAAAAASLSQKKSPETPPRSVHVVTEACIRCKYTECVEICPVDAFRNGAVMLAIDPAECIDCGACVPECPIDAIMEVPGDSTDERLLSYVALNARYATRWEVIDKSIQAMPEAERFRRVPNKLKKYFDPRPAKT